MSNNSLMDMNNGIFMYPKPNINIFSPYQEDITELPDMRDLIDIENLSIWGTSITVIDNLPPNLKVLKIGRNNISLIKNLPDKLEILHCTDCYITSLPKLPETLIKLQ